MGPVFMVIKAAFPGARYASIAARQDHLSATTVPDETESPRGLKPMGRWARSARSLVIPPLFHLLLAVWLFSGPLLQGRVLYFRDITYYFHPSSVFVERALRQGVWPLWNPMAQAGGPFLLSYPVDLGLLAAVGARA